ncbi:MAG: sigma-54 dependent transcriptional regulator [Proteobacteria bacterium]|nr:sigma-54 dependent transcriptional regulator [Pseudomonadota bacterium]
MGEILVVEDDNRTRKGMLNLFCSTDHELFGTGRISEANEILDKQDIGVVLLDVELGNTISGIDYISLIHKKNPNTQVIIVTKYDDIDHVINATKKGAFYYITKPFNPQEVIILTEKALKISDQARKAGHLEKENKLLRQRLKLSEDQKKHSIITRSHHIKEIQKQLNRIIERGVNSHILLSGESGVGKEVIARYICDIATEKANQEVPFVAINCTSIPKNLFESEFFGHEEGAFTGAKKVKHGYFELAEGGYIFLDEIGDMPLDFQVKLLRVLQEKQVRRIGGSKCINCNFKLITATNQDLKKRIAERLFREDLFYRISVIDIHIPPLRERSEDIPLLVDYFVSKINQASKRKYPTLSKKIMGLLMAYDWPGNVRELKNTVEKLLILGFDGTSYNADSLPDTITRNSAHNLAGKDVKPFVELENALSDIVKDIRNRKNVDFGNFITSLEKEVFKEAMTSCNNSGVKASKLLGISKSTFYTKLKLFNI